MRYTGPKHRISRRLKFSILETNKEFAKGKQRRTAPGMHGTKKTVLKGYGQQLVEKQKVKYMYGLTEKQLKNIYKKAITMKGSSSLNLLHIIESRLDNLVYRMGLAPTRAAARQLVNHGHILLDGRKNDIPSTTVRLGQMISLKEASRSIPTVTEGLKLNATTLPFVSFDKNKFEGTFVRYPERNELNSEINESFIIEFYNR